MKNHNLFKMLSLMILILFATMAFAVPAVAQDTRRNEISIDALLVRENPHFTRSDFKYNQTTDEKGLAFSLTRYFKESNVGVTIEVADSAHSQTSDAANLATVAGGLVIKARNRRLQPFARGLIGFSRLAARNQLLKFDKSNGGFAVIIGGGLDVKITDRVAVRVLEADYEGTRILGSTVNHARVVAGIVISF
jgi:outer membrane protein with beta-barrel domain